MVSPKFIWEMKSICQFGHTIDNEVQGRKWPWHNLKGLFLSFQKIIHWMLKDVQLQPPPPLGTFLLVAFEAVSCCSSVCLLVSQSVSFPSKPFLSPSHKVLKCEVHQYTYTYIIITHRCTFLCGGLALVCLSLAHSFPPDLCLVTGALLMNLQRKF